MKPESTTAVRAVPRGRVVRLAVGLSVVGVAAVAWVVALAAGGSAAELPPKLVFATTRADNLYRAVAYTVRDNGRGERSLGALGGDLTAPRGLNGPYEFVPLVRSPDDTHVLLIGAGGSLSISSVAGTGLRRLSPAGLQISWGGYAPEVTPLFSPNGRWVAFNVYGCAGTGSCPPHAYVVRANGSGLREIAADAGPLAWSPDSRRLTYSDSRGDVYIVGRDGSGLRLLTHGELLQSTAFSPNGKLLAYLCKGGRICVIRPDGSHRAALGKVGPEPSPFQLALIWSPDSRRIALAAAGSALMVAGLDGSVWTGTNIVGTTIVPVAWSPDSRRLAFVDYPEDQLDNESICVTPTLDSIGLAGKSLPRILSANSVVGDVHWRSDHRLTYTTQRYCNDLEIATSDANGENIRLLTNNAVADSNPVFSPDGTRIAYLQESALWAMGSDGKNKTVLWNGSTVSGTSLAWSPDGRKVAYYTDQGVQITYVEPPGTDTQRTFFGVVGGGSQASRLHWSPDGCSLLYTASVAGRTWSGAAPVPDAPVAGCPVARGPNTLGFTGTIAGNWSPDGKRIVFTGCTVKSESPDFSLCAVYTMAADGTDVREATAKQAVGTSTWNNCFDDSYSPDGRWIAFGWCDGPLPSIYVVPSGGGNVIKAIPSVQPGVHMSWAPDSSQITAELVSSRVSINTISKIVSYELPDGTLTTIVDGRSQNTQPDWPDH